MNIKKTPEKSFAIIALLLTLAVIALLIWLFGPNAWFWIWISAWSITAIIFYGFDKMQAKRSGRRVPEVVLHALSLIGGSIGALLGMVVFHHKTRKPQFWAIAIGSTVLWTLIWWFLVL